MDPGAGDSLIPTLLLNYTRGYPKLKIPYFTKLFMNTKYREKTSVSGGDRRE